MDTIDLYDGPAPGSEDWTHREQRYFSDLFGTDVVANVVTPTLTPVLPEVGNGAAVIVAPGGDVAALAGADGEQAVRYVRSHAADFGVDPGRVGFMGFSAGGNVTVRVAHTDDPLARPDFLAPIYVALRGVDLDGAPEGSGPIFLAAATDDELGLAGDSVTLYQTWRRAGLPAELHVYSRGGHGFGMRTQGLPSDSWIDRFLDWFDATGLGSD